MGKVLILVATLFFGSATAGVAKMKPYAHAEIHPEIFKFVKQYERQIRALENEVGNKLRRGNERDLDALVDLRRLVSASLKLTWTVANPFTTYPRLGEELREARRLSDTAKKTLKRVAIDGLHERISKSQAALVKLETAYRKRTQQQLQRTLASQ